MVKKRKLPAPRARHRGGKGNADAALAAELRRWRERWALANEVEIRELRAMTPEQKIQTLNLLRESAGIFKKPRSGQMARERAELCRRWAKLHEVLGD